MQTVLRFLKRIGPGGALLCGATSLAATHIVWTGPWAQGDGDMYNWTAMGLSIVATMCLAISLLGRLAWRIIAAVLLVPAILSIMMTSAARCTSPEQKQVPQP